MGLFSSSSNTSSSRVDATKMRMAFQAYMDKKDVKYSVFDEDDNIVYLSFGGSPYETFVMADFDEDNDCDSVHFSSTAFAHCEPSNKAACYVKLLEMNKRFRWVKFYMDEDGDITADGDLIVHYDTVGADCVQYIFRMSNIIEKALADLEGTARYNKDMKDKFDLIAAMKRMSQK